ncbi:MAG TPA: hypothetical protein ENN34_00510 [Deltaproteobacteria bacterium]|nr:hypothetical protein [Deltaproteobacteria bacterium]
MRNELSKVLACSLSDRARTIIDSPYTRQILEQLPSQEAYLIIKDSWGTDSQILLQYVNPETVVHFIDLDCWERDAFSIEGLADWLYEIQAASLDILMKTLEGLDLETIALLFKSYLEVVHVVPTDEHIADLLDEGFESLDNLYYFRVIRDDDRESFIRDLLSLFFSHDQDTYFRIMEGVISEQSSFLEETMFERRSLRLMEMGFPSSEEALGIYRYSKPSTLLNRGLLKEKTPQVNKDLHQLPVAYLDSIFHAGSLIVNALERTTAETQERILYEMIYLANKIIMADFKPLNDSAQIRASMGKASSIASLGLDMAMHLEKRSAEYILESTNAETLFSIGYTMILEQQQRLRRLLFQIEFSMVPERLNEFVEGLLRKRPLYREEEFSSLQQIERVKATLDTLEDMVGLISDLHRDREIDSLGKTNVGPGIDLENILLTSLVVNFSEGITRFRPLSRDELGSFIHQATTLNDLGNRILLTSASSELHDLLSMIQPRISTERLASVADMLHSRFEEECSSIVDIDSLDPRFISCFVVEMQD